MERWHRALDDGRRLRLFLAVAEEGNINRAAKRVHMAQPPLSRQIHALEEELGVTLFYRKPKGMELTEAGRALVEEVRHLLGRTEKAADRVRSAAVGELGRLDVGLFGSGILDVVPRILTQFHRRFPKVRIALHNLNKAEQLLWLRDRRLTVGFNRYVPEEPDIEVERIYEEPLMVALPITHPLVDQDRITVQMLDGVPLILYPNLPLHGLAQEVRLAFQSEGVAIRVEQEVEDFLTAVALVSVGYGVTITTQSAVNLNLPNVAYRPFYSERLSTLELCCLWRKDDHSPILAEFMGIARDSSQWQQGSLLQSVPEKPQP